MAKNEVQALRRILASQIRHYRRSKEWTQSRLAERSSLSLDMIGRLERGTASASLDTVARLSDALGVQPATLLGGQPLVERKGDNRDDLLNEILKLLMGQSASELERMHGVLKAITREPRRR